MRSTFSGIEMMKRSLFTHQTSLQTVGHNISNANTKGYSRQRVNHVAMFPLDYPSLQRTNFPGQLGQGVEFDSIKRVREQFLDRQYIKEQRDYGQWTTRRDTLEKIESVVNEPSDTSIRRLLEKFWNSWQDLSKDPENLSARAVVREVAVATADAFNHVSTQLTDLKSDILVNIDMKMREINTYTTQIANLNEQIFRMELLGQNANDLRDKRDLLIDDISKIVNVSVVEDDNGYIVSMGTIELVNSNEVMQTFDTTTLKDAYTNNEITSGELYGMYYSNDNYVDYYLTQLNSMVQSLVEGEFEITLPKGSVIPDGVDVGVPPGLLIEDTTITVKGINQMHQLGFQMSEPLSAGLPFFTTKDASDTFTAENIVVNPLVYANLGAIAASSRTYTSSSGEEKPVIGNGLNALNIANIRNKRIEFLGGADQSLTVNGNFDDFFRTLIGALGVQSQEAERQELNQKFLVDQVDARRQSVSGVSMDEEMADMVRFQHAYNAAARTMTTYDEMLDKIINGMGQVGR